jgi:hypothetical protein
VAEKKKKKKGDVGFWMAKVDVDKLQTRNKNVGSWGWVGVPGDPNRLILGY